MRANRIIAATALSFVGIGLLASPASAYVPSTSTTFPGTPLCDIFSCVGADVAYPSGPSFFSQGERSVQEYNPLANFVSLPVPGDAVLDPAERNDRLRLLEVGSLELSFQDGTDEITDYGRLGVENNRLFYQAPELTGNATFAFFTAEIVVADAEGDVSRAQVALIVGNQDNAESFLIAQSDSYDAANTENTTLNVLKNDTVNLNDGITASRLSRAAAVPNEPYSYQGPDNVTIDKAYGIRTVGQDQTEDVANTVYNPAGTVKAGTVAVAADGRSITFTPTQGYVGPAVFFYQAVLPADAGAFPDVPGNGGPVASAISYGSQSTAAVTLNVTGSTAFANPDTLSTEFRTAKSVNVLTNDAPGLKLGAATLADPSNGTLSFTQDGLITFTPGKTFSGSAVINYTADDGSTKVFSTLTVDVSPGALPVAQNDTVSVVQDTTSSSFNVLTNDTTFPQGILTAKVVAGPTSGTLVLNTNGTGTYTPKAGFVGTDSFRYAAVDELGRTSEATVAVSVTAAPVVSPPTGTAPVTAPDAATTSLNVSVNVDVLSNDTTNNGPLTLVSATNGANGTATVVDGKVRYAPNTSFTGTDSVSYTVRDQAGLTSTGTLTITITPLSVLTAAPDALGVVQGTPGSVDVLANDKASVNATLELVSAADGKNGTVRVVDGKVLYTPQDSFVGTDSFTYQVRDTSGQTATGTVAVTVTAAPLPTTAPDTLTVMFNTPGTSDVLLNDTSFDKSPLTLVSVNTPTNGVAEIIDGKVRYTPNLGFTGTDSVEYTVRDRLGRITVGTLAVVVSPQSVVIPVNSNNPFINTPVSTPRTPVAVPVASNGPVASNRPGTTPTASNTPDRLAYTGAETTPLLGAAGLLGLIGAALIKVARRR